MNKRPTSITITSWILVLIGLFSLVASTMSLNNPMVKEMMNRSPIPISVQYIMMYFGLLAQVVSGTAMLKGKNWGRLLYTIWSGIGLTIGLITSPMKNLIVPGIIFYVVVVFILFRPKSNEFFKPKNIDAN